MNALLDHPVSALPLLAGLLLPGLTLAPALDAQTPTQLRVRAVSHDAKIIGSGVGGARITIRDAATGEVLAEGIQEGETGDTDAIVREPRVRGEDPFDTPDAAHFTATLELDEPTLVVVTAEGPVEPAHAVQGASATLLMVPGVDVLGNGLVLELHGFTVEVTEAAATEGGELSVRAEVTMLCGCPLESGGLWDADRIDVRAQLVRDGEVVAEAPLDFTGETNVFAGAVEVPGEDPAGGVVRVLALDPERVNTGMGTLELEPGTP